MKKAVIRITDSTNYRLASWVSGFKRLGYQVTGHVEHPQPGDVLVLWNRSPRNELEALRFEAAGALVLVAENGYMGKEWGGHKWFALSAGHHNGRGKYPLHLGEARCRKYGLVLAGWRFHGHEIIALPQRGIGEAGVAMPKWWSPPAWTTRIRPHMGIKPCTPLEDDLRDAKAVVTWGSGAAIKAMAWGIPVFYDLRGWIGAAGAVPLSDSCRFDPLEIVERCNREAAFSAVFAAMWTDEEIESGEGLNEVIQCAC